MFYDSVDLLRLMLALSICIVTSGLPGMVGAYIQVICGFATISYYILSGYFIFLDEERLEERLIKAIKRTAITFGILAVIYFFLSLIYAILLGAHVMDVLRVFSEKWVWFDWLVLQIWPFSVGGTIWFIQAMLYAYVIIFILYKLKLFKLLKLDVILVPVLLIFAVISGELSDLVGFHFMGVTGFSANFFTRALPYILLGGLLAKYRDKLSNLSNSVIVIYGFLGILASVGEIVVLLYTNHLSYTGHMIGNGILALAVCLYMILNPRVGYMTILPNITGQGIAKVTYYIQQPLIVFVDFALISISPTFFRRVEAYLGLIVFVVILVGMSIAGSVLKARDKRRNQYRA